MIQFDRSDAYDFPGVRFISEPVTGFAENFFAARENLRLNDQSQSRQKILGDLWTPIHEEMVELFPGQGFGGNDFKNPGDYLSVGLGMYSASGTPEDRYNFEANLMLDFMRNNQESLPDHLKGITLESLEQTARERAQAARKTAEEIGSRSETFSGTLGSFTGGVVGLLDDEVNAIAGLGFLSKAKTLWRLAFTEAVIGAGAGAVAEAGVKEWYDELGYDYDYKDFIRNVSFNAVGSAALGVGVKLTADGVRSGWNALSKSGQANKNSQNLADAAQAAEDLEADNPLSDADMPPAQAEHSNRAIEAEAAVENNKAPAMSNDPTIMPKIFADVSDINAEMLALKQRLDEISQEKADLLEGLTPEQIETQKADLQKKGKALDDERKKISERQEKLGEEYQKRQAQAVAGGQADNLNGVMFSVNARDVNIDAKRFQFKEGGDEYGVTERLQGVTEWDPVKAGTVIFWEDSAGKMFVADGHQRVGLARRIQAQKPDQDIDIIGYKLRETDGVSAEKARVIAAMANIAQGTGTVIDAAKVLRLEPGRISELPPQSVLVRQARDLVNLSNQAFGAIVNEVIPANYGAIVGRLIDDPDLQDAAIAVLAKADPSNAFQAEAIVRQVKEMDTVQEEQVSLFGEEMITQSLFMERAKVLDRATKLLRGDKKAFESLSKNAERIEAEGNKLAKDQNQRRADQDGQAITLVQALANRKGVLSDDLSASARTARETGNYAAAARGFADAVRRGIERGDFDGAATGDVGRAIDVAPQSRPDALEQEPALEGFDEPTGPAAEAQTDQMVLDTYRELDEAEPKIPQVLKPGDIEPDWSPYMSLQEGDTLIPVNKIRPVKVRPEGVKNAVPFMQQAARGEIDKRPAILVKENEDGSYSVRDGNSTYAIAAQAGWPEMPVKIVNDQEYATEQARKAVDRIFKQDTLGKTKRRFVVAKDLEGPELKVIQNRLSDRQPRDADAYMAMATKNHDDLNATAEAAAKELGMDFERAPVKLLEKINKKLARKGRAGQIHTIADAARTGITARTIEESDAFVAALAKKFHIIDEGWIITPAGYFDRKLIVVFDDGGLGEIQIWPPGMLDVKQNPTKFDKSGHDYYDIANDPKSSPDVVADANAKMIELYGLVQSELDPSFSRKLGFDAPSAESIGSTASVESSTVRSLESVALARSADPVQPRSGPDQVTALDPSMATISPSASLKNRNVPSYELTEAGDQLLIPGVEPITTQQLMRAASDEPMRGGEAAMPEGGLFDDDALSQIDISDITAGIKPEDFDMEIPVDMRVEGDVVVAEVKTLRDIKDVIEAEDAMIKRLGVCGL